MTRAIAGPSAGFSTLSRSERAARTAALLDAPAISQTARREILLEVAALNLDVAMTIATCMAARQCLDTIDRRDILESVRADYVEAVLSLELPLRGDFVTRIAPHLRSTIRELARARAGSALLPHHPG